MREESAPELVYVIGSPQSSIVKIGRTQNLDRHLRDLQRMSPVPLAVPCTFSGGAALEAALHRHFKDRRSHGEWFDMGELDPVVEAEAAVLLVDETHSRPKTPVIVSGEIEHLRVTRHAPGLCDGDFQLDPHGGRIKKWPLGSVDDHPYFTHEPDASGSFPRCWCGHPIGTHTADLPHPCDGEFWVQGIGGDPCLCLGYEGPLPAELADTTFRATTGSAGGSLDHE
ncbi:GIY-YIG nuclease family protein [Streptomyces sp.]|uniref:GIY-YIG nuclease family protein n=1 Tax=Streptomyces sp. TaxID=1931 RepID=UPI002D78B0AB|nr:GIY-YIG nuclease family protein [Streptomyces sp.]HET6354866.1 GIY-YIG nuclease family protein [Streptomyces sp.]